MERTVLLVDDEASIRKNVRRTLEKHHWKVIEAASYAEAEAVLNSDVPLQTILLDLNLPDGLGWDLIEKVRGRPDRPALIVITGEGSIDHAITAVRTGASDFLLKPFTTSQLEDALARSCTERPMRGSMAAFVKPIDRWRSDNAQQILGNHPSILRMLEMIRRVADTVASVLVTGESGTGKELVARAVHMASRRRHNPLVVLNCAAIPENLIESELFGHVKGAFTGATSTRQGHFVAADTGTIFLDEIGDLPLPMQSKLLRVVQEHEVTPVGRDQSIKIDTRIIAATNVDLEKAVADGRFREDLYYRLNVIPIEVPALREWRSDIPDLIACFIDRYNKRLGCAVTGLERGVVERLQEYDWPGNVRELENTLERMVLFRSVGRLEIADLPDRLQAGADAGDPIDAATLPTGGLVLRDAVDSYEWSLIEQALTRANGNTSKAARLMNVHRTTLIEKINRLCPDRDEARDAKGEAEQGWRSTYTDSA